MYLSVYTVNFKIQERCHFAYLNPGYPSFFFLNCLNGFITIPWVTLNFFRFFPIMVFEWQRLKVGDIFSNFCLFSMLYSSSGVPFSYRYNIYDFFSKFSEISKKLIVKVIQISFIWFICNLNIKMKKKSCSIIRTTSKNS